MQTGPGLFDVLHPFLPTSHVAEVPRRLVTGGGLEPVSHACPVR